MTTASNLKAENVLGATNPSMMFDFVLLVPYAETPPDCWPFFRADPVDEFFEQVQFYSKLLNDAYKRHGEFSKCPSLSGQRACQTCIDMSGYGYYVRDLTKIVNAVDIVEVRPSGLLAVPVR